jgi:hypothetical protein
MYEHGKMRPVKIIPETKGGRTKRMIEGVNSTMIYFKTFVNVTMYLQYNKNMIINNNGLIVRQGHKLITRNLVNVATHTLCRKAGRQ